MQGAETTCAWARPSEGYRQEAAFTEHGVFMNTVLPTTDAVGGVLICPPATADDVILNYRREVILSRRLAAGGVITQRFHYRGTGNSGGDLSTIGWDQVMEDALSAHAELTRRCGSLPIAYFGSRFGALVAASLAAERGPAPLAVWDPVVDVATHVREAIRLERVAALGGSARTTDSSNTNSEDLAARRIPAGIVDARKTLTLDSVIKGGLDAVYVATLLGTGRVRDRTDTAFIGRSPNVETASFTDNGWWPTGRITERAVDEPWPLIDNTAAWLREHLLTERGCD